LAAALLTAQLNSTYFWIEVLFLGITMFKMGSNFGLPCIRGPESVERLAGTRNRNLRIDSRCGRHFGLRTRKSSRFVAEAPSATELLARRIHWKATSGAVLGPLSFADDSVIQGQLRAIRSAYSRSVQYSTQISLISLALSISIWPVFSLFCGLSFC
jgi:hypothetical protein